MGSFQIDYFSSKVESEEGIMSKLIVRSLEVPIICPSRSRVSGERLPLATVMK
jgi:hypothetical protein